MQLYFVCSTGLLVYFIILFFLVILALLCLLLLSYVYFCFAMFIFSLYSTVYTFVCLLVIILLLLLLNVKWHLSSRVRTRHVMDIWICKANAITLYYVLINVSLLIHY